MRTAIRTLLLLPLSAAAFAATPAELAIDNESGHRVEVWVDGAWRGTVYRDDERSFSALPGRHVVRVASDDGLVLFDGAVDLSPYRRAEIDVAPPATPITLFNSGDAPVFVTVGGRPGFWMLPRASETVQVRGPFAHIETQISGRRGLSVVGTWDLGLRPGQALRHDVGFRALPPTTAVTFTNAEPNTVRVYVDGGELAAVRSGETVRLELRNGRHDVLLIEQRGGVIFQRAVDFDPRQPQRVWVQGGATWSLDDGRGAPGYATPGYGSPGYGSPGHAAPPNGHGPPPCDDDRHDHRDGSHHGHDDDRGPAPARPVTYR